MFARGVIVLLCVLVAVSDGAREPDCKPYSGYACPKNYDPVCGSDGITYANECMLCLANTISNTTIIIEKEGECDRPLEPDCKPNPSNLCTWIYRPVCGSDGKTYGNECLLCVAIKESNTTILIVKQGECDQLIQPDCKLYSSNICPLIYDPVCGSDGKTYGNECMFCAANQTSNTAILIVKEGECDQPHQPNCKPYSSKGCPKIYRPVCGSDGKTYGHECDLCAANLESNTTILIQKPGKCDQPQQPDCKLYSDYVCTLDIAPVCGSDGKTYGHECDLCAANLTSNTAILIVKQGECDQPQQPNCKPNPSKICLMIYDPVCGSDGKTYGNECELCVAIEESNTTILIVKQGECDQLIQPNCKPYLPNMCLIYKPVCGSDGKTYDNECRFCVANEISNNTILIQKEGECDQPLQV